jgi:hypothetical protein
MQIAFRAYHSQLWGARFFMYSRRGDGIDPFTIASVALFSLTVKVQNAPETYHAKRIYLRESAAWGYPKQLASSQHRSKARCLWRSTCEETQAGVGGNALIELARK